ncbi:MFS transporter [Methylocapsa sp. S129]|uniref:MFS transporter n=1 Tax=Methylocapsa sp. S129 TaxID=1641869 RepID=UPI00131CEDA5|nr:MFS transporter [Methylocapsa sp. S129]
MSDDQNLSATPAELAPSRWGAFGHAAFTIIWTASIVSNIGTAMFDTGSAWLMTSLNADPMAVSLVQAASRLPIFLFVLPAGALADVIDSRRFLIIVEIAIAILTAVFATVVSLGLATPTSLLATTFLLSAGLSLTAPAWLSITPFLVTRPELDAASAANSVGYNIARAVGPALGGLAIAGLGVAAPFWIACLGDLAMIAALLWWRSPQKSAGSLPAERLTSAVRTGLRYAANSGHLRATFMRALAFFPFAAAYWALLPLVARRQMIEGPEFYGLLLGAIGAGAIGGSIALNWLKAKLGPDRVVASGTLATAFALVLFGLARDPITALCACLVAGASWTIVLASLYVSAQVALPDWVRARGLAILLTVVYGAMTVGSAAWGHIAGLEGLQIAHFAAAAGALLAIPLTWRWKLQTAAEIDLTPSLHWQAPPGTQRVDDDRGPVLVTIEYRLESQNRDEFLSVLDELGQERKRDGAYAWNVFEDAADRGRFLETFLIQSWLELMHARERVTNADRMLEEQVRRLLKEPAHVTLLVAPEATRRADRKLASEILAAPVTPSA